MKQKTIIAFSEIYDNNNTKKTMISNLKILNKAFLQYDIDLEAQETYNTNGFINVLNELQNGRSPSMYNTLMAALRGYLTWSHAPIEYIRLPMYLTIEKKQTADYCYSDEEFQRLLDIDLGHDYSQLRNKALLIMIRECPLYITDICDLVISHYYEILNYGTITIFDTNGKMHKVSIDSSKIIPYLEPYIKERFRKDLYRYMSSERQKEYEMKSPLFITNHGNKMDTRRVYSSLESRLNACGLTLGVKPIRKNIKTSSKTNETTIEQVIQDALITFPQIDEKQIIEFVYKWWPNKKQP